MPILFLLSIACQIACGLHVVKTRQERYWLYLIIIFPFLGCLIYALAILLPELLGSYKGRQAVNRLQDKVLPTRHLKKLQSALYIADTPENNEALADELSRLHHYNEALPYYQKALTGIYHDKPQLLLKLAKAQFHADNYLECQKTLDLLIERNPEFRSQEGHLLYARALQMAGNFAKADEEYKVLVSYYSGPQARFYYASLLYHQGQLTEAKQQLEEIMAYAKIMPKHYRTLHADCLSDTKKQLQSLQSKA